MSYSKTVLKIVGKYRHKLTVNAYPQYSSIPYVLNKLARVALFLGLHPAFIMTLSIEYSTYNACCCIHWMQQVQKV